MLSGAPSAGPAHGHLVVCIQRTRHGAVLAGVPVAYRQRGVDLHLLQLTDYKPLYRDLRERGWRGGLTSEAIGLMVADGVEART
jgi:hypothetical protein